MLKKNKSPGKKLIFKLKTTKTIKKCFDILKDCIVYAHENHPEMLEKFYISKYYHRPKTGAKDRRPINIEDLKNVSYKDFKMLLNGMGIADIREAYVKFKKQPKEKTEHFALSDADNRLIDEITTWAEDWEAYKEGNGLPFTKTERKKFLSDCIRYMGHQELEKSFIEEQETEKEDPFGNIYRFDDPIGYFTRRLPELLREDKQRKGDALKG